MIINQRQWDRFNAPLFILTNSTVDQISLPHSNHHLWILEGGGAPCPLELVCCWLSWTFSLPLWKDQRCPLFQTLSSNFLRSEAILSASSWSESLTVHEEYYMYHMHQYYQMFYKLNYRLQNDISKECCNNNHDSFPVIFWCKCINK